MYARIVLTSGWRTSANQTALFDAFLRLAANQPREAALSRVVNVDAQRTVVVDNSPTGWQYTSVDAATGYIERNFPQYPHRHKRIVARPSTGYGFQAHAGTPENQTLVHNQPATTSAGTFHVFAGAGHFIVLQNTANNSGVVAMIALIDCFGIQDKRFERTDFALPWVNAWQAVANLVGTAAFSPSGAAVLFTHGTSTATTTIGLPTERIYVDPDAYSPEIIMPIETIAALPGTVGQVCLTTGSGLMMYCRNRTTIVAAPSMQPPVQIGDTVVVDGVQYIPTSRLLIPLK